jgi:cholest-4-en-3-one 26-monooxygenase
MQAMFDHPDQWERLEGRPCRPRGDRRRRDHPLGPPGHPVPAADHVGHDDRRRPIPAGEKVVIYYASANRDEDVFDDPYSFDIGRDPNPHISFGGGGPHFCLGAHLAKLEVKIMFETLATRMPDVRPTGTPRRLRSTFINGIKEMPVSFTGQ